MTLKKEIEEILHPERKSLRPPRAPKILTEEQKEYLQDNLMEMAKVDYGNKTFERPIVGEKSSEGNVLGSFGVEALPTPYGTDSKPTIDFSYYLNLSKSSEFRRLEYLIRTGKTHRGTLKELDRDLMEFHKKVGIVNKLPIPRQGLPKEVLEELKEVLRKRND